MDGPSQSGANNEEFNIEDLKDDDNKPNPNVLGAS
jgi:hypothetical protein